MRESKSIQLFEISYELYIFVLVNEISNDFDFAGSNKV